MTRRASRDRFRDGTGVLRCAGRPVAPLEIAASLRTRYRGLLGRDGISGALLLVGVNGVHTLGMRFAIDVAYLTADLRVLTVVTMRPGRFSPGRLRARHTVEAEAGRLAVWGIGPGDMLEVRAGTTGRAAVDST